MKKRYNIFRYNTPSGVADKIALMACKSNGIETPITLQEMEAYFKCYVSDNPTLQKAYVLSIVDNILFLDDNRELALKIEEIEIAECEPAKELTNEQARNFIKGSIEDMFNDCPTLFRNQPNPESN